LQGYKKEAYHFPGQSGTTYFWAVTLSCVSVRPAPLIN